MFATIWSWLVASGVLIKMLPELVRLLNRWLEKKDKVERKDAYAKWTKAVGERDTDALARMLADELRTPEGD